MLPLDEGYNDDEFDFSLVQTTQSPPSSERDTHCSVEVDIDQLSAHEREELAMRLLGTMSRNQLGKIHRQVLPMLKLDILALLPTEIALMVLRNLPLDPLIHSVSLVSKRWNVLANDPTLWKALCDKRSWEWKPPNRHPLSKAPPVPRASFIDEGFGEDETESFGPDFNYSHDMTSLVNDFSMLGLESIFSPSSRSNFSRHSAPAVLPSLVPHSMANYKALFKTRTILRKRLRTGQFQLTRLPSTLTETRPTSLAPHHVLMSSLNPDLPMGHTSTIYALCLAEVPDPITSVPIPMMFTASRDQTILQWTLLSSPSYACSRPVKVFQGAHTGSILTICVCLAFEYLISGGSDGRVVVWSLRTGNPVRVFEGGAEGHHDSVLCVRCDDKRIVSCSKDRTLRTYTLHNLSPAFTLESHRAAVNSLSLDEGLIVSASGDRSLRLWNAETGELLRVFECHHTRGLASIDFSLPYIITGSSDRHIRLYDITTQYSWSTDSSRLGLSAGSPPDANTPPSLLPTVIVPNLTTRESATSHFEAIVASERTRMSNQEHIAFSEHSHSSRFSGFGGVEEADICAVCGGEGRVRPAALQGHRDLVRAVAMDKNSQRSWTADEDKQDVVVSASYDGVIKIWDRRSGALLADLTGGHNGRIFGIAFDCTKIVSCGEDQTVCIWDFGWGLDTSSVKL